MSNHHRAQKKLKLSATHAFNAKTAKHVSALKSKRFVSIAQPRSNIGISEQLARSSSEAEDRVVNDPGAQRFYRKELLKLERLFLKR